MIEILVVRNEMSYDLDLSPPLLELGDWGFKKECLRELSQEYDLLMGDFDLGTETDKSYQIFFRKFYEGNGETFEATVGYDSIITKSEDFKSPENAIQKHIRVLDIVLSKTDFSEKLQTISYNAHASVESGNVSEYLDKIITFQPKLPGEIKNRASIFTFDGPKEESMVQILIGDSYVVANGIYLSINFYFSGKTDKYGELFKISEDYTRKHILPSLEIKLGEPSEVE